MPPRRFPKQRRPARRLAAINSSVRVRAMVADLTPANVEELLGGAGVILDGTDNFETRYLINDFAVSRGIPWIYGAAVGSYGIDDAGDPGPHGVPALRLSRSALGRAAHLRDGGRAERRSSRRSHRSRWRMR